MATAIPENRAAFGFDEARALTGASVAGLAAAPQLNGVATDTRAELAGKLFVALRGERFDGHDYVSRAVEQGAVAALVERAVPVAVPQLVVPSALDALGALAAAHRRRADVRLIAIGGAAGKTTTRALTQALLAQAVPGAVAATPGNLNNRIGVPMVLLALSQQHQVAVVEIGTNQPGEIDLLTAICRPDVALLTLIDLEHTEGLGDLDGVEQEESRIFAHDPKVAVCNGDDPRALRQLDKSDAEQRLRYGFAADNDYRIERLQVTASGSSRVQCVTPHGRFELDVPWLPAPSAMALMGGLAAAESALGRPLQREQVAAALASATWREAGRLVLLRLGDGTWVLDDTYNANPASVRAALSAASELAAIRGVQLHLVLGEMRELGALSAEQHRALGRELAAQAFASLTAVAGDARYFAAPTAQGAERPEGFFDSSAEALDRVLACVQPGDVVLVKGSRSTHTEIVVQALVAKAGGADRL